MQNIEKVSKIQNNNLPSKINFKIILPWVLPVGIILIWQLVVSKGWIQTSVSPAKIINDAIQLTKSGELPRNISISLYRASIGMMIGGSIGLVLGSLNGFFKSIRLFSDTSIQMLRNIPHLSLIPLIIIIFGIGEPAKIALVAIGVMFPVYINTYHGIRSVDPKLIEMAKSYGLSRWQMITKIVLPGALPSVLMGIRYALGVMWTTLIVSETISSSSGIGYMANNAQSSMDITTVVLCIIIYALLGKVSDVIVKLLESVLLEWKNVEEIQ